MSMSSKYFEQIIHQVPKHRILAVDVFRGLSITAMILVNNPGNWSAIYAPLKHAPWHGWTLTDLIFPFFLFIVGISISISIGNQLAKQVPIVKIVSSSAIRTLKLFALGLFLALFYYKFGDSEFNWVNDRLFDVRIMGVLQRIAIVYFCSVLLFLFFKPKGLLIWSILLLLAHTFSLFFIPYSAETGTVYQGLLIEGNNLSAWLDQQVLGSRHVYAQTTPFVSDPEGLLSTLPAIVSCLSGILIGKIIFNDGRKTINEPLENESVNLNKVKKLLWLGLIMTILGESMGYFIPINKALWTSSYVILTTGVACLVLALCIYLLEIKKFTLWSAPLIVFGANSIAFFMFAGVSGRLLVMIPVAGGTLKSSIYETMFQPYFSPMNASLAFSIGFLIISYLLMYLMYRNKIFWKV